MLNVEPRSPLYWGQAAAVLHHDLVSEDAALITRARRAYAQVARIATLLDRVVSSLSDDSKTPEAQDPSARLDAQDRMRYAEDRLHALEREAQEVLMAYRFTTRGKASAAARLATARGRA